MCDKLTQLANESFLSTPSARRATCATSSPSWRMNHFYPRPPRGGRPHLGQTVKNAVDISIHALREEGDDYKTLTIQVLCKFLSTPSARRATSSSSGDSTSVEISIHALREEGDQFCPGGQADRPGISIHALREEGDTTRAAATGRTDPNFYPRPPRGGRLFHGSILQP